MHQTADLDKQPMIVTLDGPAGSGKSSVARLLAKRLKVAFLDTGAMYRGLTAYCLDHHIPPDDAGRVRAAVHDIDMRFDWSQDPPALHVDGKDVSLRIRDRDVTAGVSVVAANSAVRQRMVRWQRQIGVSHPRLVSEGRDQGSVVFPDALVKFYLQASAKVRAERRTREMVAAGKAAVFEEILRDIEERDRHDAGRADSPLVQPEGAVVVDTSRMTLEQVVDHLHQHVRAALSAGKRGSEQGSSGHV